MTWTRTKEKLFLLLRLQGILGFVSAPVLDKDAVEASQEEQNQGRELAGLLLQQLPVVQLGLALLKHNNSSLRPRQAKTKRSK